MSNAKADYVVRQAAHDGKHLCHGGCGKPCPPAKWGCSSCWFRLPHPLRNRIWATYRPGQEIDKMPSAAYLAAADAVHEWVRNHPLVAKKPAGLDRDLF